MPDSTMSDTYRFVLVNSIYIGLITLELASIAIKYQGSNTNPFQERGLAMILFLLALFCHAIALKAEISLPTAMSIHVSGVIACETLLWMLVAEIWRYIIINVLLTLVAVLFWRCIIISVLLKLVAALSSYYKDTRKLLSNALASCFSWVKETGRKVRQNADKTSDLEAQQGIDVQMSNW